MTREKGQAVAYAYDNLNRLTQVEVGGQVYTYGYTGASPLVQSLTRPDGSVTAYDYDPLNRLAQMATTVSGNVINQYTYTYNQQDLRAGETAVEPEPPAPLVHESVSYTYNNVNQLIQMNDPDPKVLAYDASGNLTQGYTPEVYPFTAAYDSDNRLVSLSFTDGNGAANQTQFTWLDNFLLKKQQYQDGDLVQEARHVYDGFRLLQERNPSNNVVHEYTGWGCRGASGGCCA